jgi:oligosaccharyltransferase complex subunit alpha (ribophorin I)
MRTSLFVFALVCAFYSASCKVPSDISVITSRDIDISSQLAKYIVSIKAKNNGGDDVSSFIHPISKEENSHLSYIHAYQGSDKMLQVSQLDVPLENPNYAYYKITFASPLKKGSTVDFKIEYVLTKFFKVYPAEITQSESQFVLWKGSSSYVSVYSIESDETKVKVGSGKVVSHTGTKSGNAIAFGPNKNISPFTNNEVSIHYENNAPFVVVTSLERTIEVSHWGNIAIEDHVEIVHKGAKLKGSFSRLDFQIDRRTKSPIVKSLKATLPAQASDIYYRDQIGNISTSMVRGYDNRVEVEMRPRFPLLGGWRTNYILGYNVPSREFLYSTGSNYALKIPLIHPLYDNMVIEKAEIKIILPETAHNFKIVKPYTVSQLPNSLHYTYLDTVGRPVLTFQKDNLVEHHSQQFTIYYEYSFMSILREPIIAVVALMAIFAAFIFFNRCDFSIVRREGVVTSHIKTD